MRTKIYAFMTRKLSQCTLETNTEKHLYIILTATVLFSALCHVIQIIFFIILGHPPMVLLNIGSLTVYAVCMALLNANYLKATGILYSLEISIVAAIYVYCIGTDTFVITYFLSILLAQMIIPYAGWGIRIPMISLICLLSLVSFVVNQAIPHPVDMANIKTAYSIFNILVGLAGTISIVAINNTISKIIVQFNDAQLKKYRNEAHLDALTGLYNRRYADLIFQEIRDTSVQNANWCVAMLDIDDFKVINDTYGHDVGDVVLCSLANLITSSLRRTDYVFRWGGEEFLMLLRNATPDQAHATLDKMRVKIQDSAIVVVNTAISLTVTIGLSSLDPDDPAQSIRESDQNLYLGKRAQKNVVVK